MNTSSPPVHSGVTVHRWDVSAAEARKIQESLRHNVITADRLGKVLLVGGADVYYSEENRITAAVAVLTFPGLELREYSIIRGKTAFPYMPGLLSFREAPAIFAALSRLEHLPDLLLCDGQGIAHPRRFGIASHIGVLTGTPTIGVAKTRLTGDHQPVPMENGGWSPLIDNGEPIGAVLRTRTGVKPLYISPGHNISLETAIRYVMGCVTRYRLPETTRWAHKLASGG